MSKRPANVAGGTVIAVLLIFLFSDVVSNFMTLAWIFNWKIISVIGATIIFILFVSFVLKLLQNRQ